MRRFQLVVAVVAIGIAIAILAGPSGAGPTGRFAFQPSDGRPHLSGVADPNLVTLDAAVTASATAAQPAVASDDIQVNGDNKANPTQQFGSGEGLPQNETSIAVNPTDPSNVIGGANDYEAAVDSVLGIYASFNGGRTWPYSHRARQIITPDRRMLGSGDPVIAFDGAGTAYAGFISFGRADCDSYIGVIRSIDKGVTWSVPVDGASAGTGLVVGDGIVVHNGGPADCQIFHDKVSMTAGLRPAGVALVPGTDPAFVTHDRLYVAWGRFDLGPAGDSYVEAPIYLSYSDDQGRHWSSPQEISGSSAALCTPQLGDQDAPACDDDQFASPVVDPRTGALYVAFENFNVSGITNQYLVVKSTDGGQTFSAPVRVTGVVDGPGTYPVCLGSQTLDEMCARVNANGNLDLDPRSGSLYLTWADNRNGTATDTNTDVFVSKSTDGGGTWSPPLNVTGHSVDDQFFPWLSVNPNGVVAIAYFDRQYTPPKLIDTSLAVSTNGGASFDISRVTEVSSNPDLGFRLGFFIGDYNALDTTARTALPFWTDERFAEPNVEGNNPPHQQSDVMVDVERLP